MLALSPIQTCDRDAYPALVQGLRTEFRTDDVDPVAAWFLDAEIDDFRWESRVAERGLGAMDAVDSGEQIELDRVAFLGRLDGHWYAATACVDGDGRLWSMQGCTEFADCREAERAFRVLV